jgi:FKBP-type peptidyl-prolyl cis-trans isomerase
MTNKQFTTGIAAIVGVVVVLLFFVFGNPFTAIEQGLPANAVGSMGGQLLVQDTLLGTGEEAQIGSIITMHYTGMFEDGTVFDSSVGGQPYRFVLGGGQVVPGLDQGLQGMRAGGKRLIIIPPELAYGAQGYGPIPGNTTIVFDIELLSVQ